MPRKLAAYLWDLTKTIDLIGEFTAGMAFSDFERNDLAVAAVERNISILGEALRQMLEHYPEEATFVGGFTPFMAFRTI